MLELLKEYSISQILILAVFIAIAIKEVIQFIDWARQRTLQQVTKSTSSIELIKKIEEKDKDQDKKIEQMLEAQKTLSENIDLILQQVQNLIKSDRDAIKAYITKEHHHFCYEVKWIDDYNLDCLEKRYQRYVEEGGNSFIESLMEEIRDLPRRPPIQ